jgi:hypothetical protein
MQTTIFEVTHDFEIPESLDNGRFIGAYSTRARAEAAVARTSKLPGFSNYPDGFVIGEVTIGKDHWTSGFISGAEAMLP